MIGYETVYQLLKGILFEDGILFCIFDYSPCFEHIDTVWISYKDLSYSWSKAYQKIQEVAIINGITHTKECSYPKLTSLVCNGNIPWYIKCEQLKTLYIYYPSRKSIMRQCIHLKTLILYMDSNKLKFLEPLHALEHLQIEDSYMIKNLLPLRKCTALRFLHLEGSHTIRDLTPLYGKPLQYLYIGECRVSDLKPLHWTHTLQYLYIVGWSIDPKPVRHLKKAELWIDHERILSE